MILNFPNNPTPSIGQIFTGTNSVTYVYDGTKWIGQISTGGGATDRLIAGDKSLVLDNTGRLSFSDGAYIQVVDTSYLDINYIGDIKLDNSGGTWTFGTDGKLTLPGGSILSDTNGRPNLTSVHNFKITTDSTTNFQGPYDWEFGEDGTFTLPVATSGHSRFQNNGAGFEFVSDTNTWTFDTDGTLTLPASSNQLYTTTNALIKSISDIQVSAGDDVGSNWIFGGNGTLTTPGDILPEANNSYNLGSPDRQWNHIYVNTGSIYLGGIKLSTDNNQLSVQQITNIGGNETVIQNYALSNADRLVKGENQVILNTDGDLLLSRNAINQGGHYYQDAVNNGNTSIRWINVDTGGQNIEMARVYAVGGNPTDGYGDQFDFNERLQLGQRELGNNTSSFYINVTRNEIGLGVNEADDFRWEFYGNGNFVTPDALVIGPGNYNNVIIGITGKDLNIGSETQGLSIQANGGLALVARDNSEAPTVIAGAFAYNTATNGGDLWLYGGASIDGVEGNVYANGRNVELLGVEAVNIGSNYVNIYTNNDNEWSFDSKGGLTFPDLTTQYTAWQGAAIVSDNAPDNELGRLWFNSIDGRMYVKYNDIWVDTNPVVVPSPETYLDGLTIDGTTIGVADPRAEQTINIADNLRILGNKIYINGHEISVTAQGKITVDGGETVTVLDGGSASSWLLPV